MTYYAFTYFICTCYALIMESCQAFVFDLTLGALGIELLADELNIAKVR